jgi:ketosteroid isomerase-like protein
MTNENEMNALAERMKRAYEQDDIDAVVACYTPDARIWHNIDGVEQTVQDQVGAMRWLNEKLKNLRQEILTRDFFDGGYVQQYVVHGTLVDGGGTFRMPLCMRVIVRDGRVARLDEYLDSAHLKLLQT